MAISSTFLFPPLPIHLRVLLDLESTSRGMPIPAGKLTASYYVVE